MCSWLRQKTRRSRRSPVSFCRIRRIKKKQSKGTVVAVGPGKMQETGNRSPIAVAVGQMVLFKEPWGDESKIEDGDKKYFLVEEDDILAVIE